MTASQIPNWSIICLRLVLGWFFTYSGYIKVITYISPQPNWSAQSFLIANQSSPFGFLFKPLIGSLIVDYLNAFGLFFIGIALLFGLFIRWTTHCGIVLMTLYWLADFPPGNALLIDQHIIYIVCFLILNTFRAGQTFGIDGYLKRFVLIQKFPFLTYLIG